MEFENPRQIVIEMSQIIVVSISIIWDHLKINRQGEDIG